SKFTDATRRDACEPEINLSRCTHVSRHAESSLFGVTLLDTRRMAVDFRVARLEGQSRELRGLESRAWRVRAARLEGQSRTLRGSESRVWRVSSVRSTVLDA